VRLDEDRELRNGLAAMDPAALASLRRVLVAPVEDRDALLRSLVGRADARSAVQLLAIAGTDEAARLRLLRAIRDLGVR
jgi:hypothetical protein